MVEVERKEGRRLGSRLLMDPSSLNDTPHKEEANTLYFISNCTICFFLFYSYYVWLNFKTA